MFVVVLEGADSVGKSTIADILQRQLGASLFHTTRPMPLSYYKTVFETSCERPVVLDRGWLSTAVYTSLLDRYTPYTPVDAHLLSLCYPVYRFIITGDPLEVEARKKPDDLPITTAVVQDSFRVLAHRYGFAELVNDDAELVAERIVGVVDATLDGFSRISFGFPGNPYYIEADQKEALTLFESAPFSASVVSAGPPGCAPAGSVLLSGHIPANLWLLAPNGLASHLMKDGVYCK